MHIGEAFVVSQIEVSLVAVVGDVAFAMFVGVQGAGVDVDVGVELLDCHPEAAGFQQTCQRRGNDSFAQRRNNAACDKNVFGVHDLKNIS